MSFAILRKTVAGLALLLLAAALALRPAPTAQAQSADDPAAVVGWLTVAFRPAGLSEGQARARLARHGARLDRWLPELGLARVAVASGRERVAARALETEDLIAYAVEERYSVEIADAPLDEHWPQQWGPAKVGLPAARQSTAGDPSVIIAVIDTGALYAHWDLRDQIWINPGESALDPQTGARTCSDGPAQNGIDDDGNGYVDDCRGYNFDLWDEDPGDAHGHGTVVAGIVAAATNNPGHYTDGRYEGIAGMGGSARIMVLAAMNAGGRGVPFNIAEAIRYAANNGASVINLSLTLPVNFLPEDRDTLCAATDYARAQGLVVVGASGNDSYAWSAGPVSYPAACAGVVAVGASARDDRRASFSNAGERLDLVAPGEGIFSTLRTSSTAYGIAGSGTSFAAPHVAGAAALALAVRPGLREEQLRDLLRRTAHDVELPGFDPMTGWGRLDAARLVQAALPPAPVRLPFVAR